ncbi:sensor histidine kinase [Ralstonia syzygii]|uniref:sensor histidine kinase n=1 Tax=Ralstonia syzygii TaxID=28097 RepID=UPI0018D1E2D3|nr:HAMP domain-containing sensor histidine kinase [Ralstonia syzygii]
MFRVRLSLAFALMVALVCVQAGFVYWGANRVNDYATHSRLASDILSELLELSANKQRLRVWASQRLMNADASPELRDRMLASMQASAATLRYLAKRDIDLWGEISARDGVPIPPEVDRLTTTTDLLGDNIAAVQARLVALVPLQRDAEFAGVWRELNQVFDMARGRDLRELINGAIERQRRAVPIARAATERGLDRVRTQALSMVVLVLLAAVALARHLNRRLQRPLDRLLEGARALRAGALDHRVPIGSGGELRTAHDTLQRIDQRRRQLFADLGHELRTPTTAIRGEAEIALRGGDKPSHEYRMALERIVGGAKQLTGRINDLLLIAKAEADQLAMRPQLIDLPSVLHDAADLADALGAEHDVKIRLALPQDAAALTLPAAPDRLRQAIVIVLDNAVRYSPRGGTVHLCCHIQPDTVRIEVQDHGIGIDADELPMVFERFVHGRRARAHRADGTGIGLSIAQAIVQAHRGHITLQSTPQQGTRVCIELPRHRAAGADTPQHRHEHSRH